MKQEYERLRQTLAPAAALLHVDPFRSASGLSIETALAHEAAIFHYGGHADWDGEQGYLVREVVPHADQNEVDRLYSRQLAGLLHRAAVKLALFNACNSGYRVFAQPLMAAGLPALVGVQGPVVTVAAERFCDVLYRFIVAGLSLECWLPDPPGFVFTPENLDWAQAEIKKYPEGRQASAVLSLLWRAQEQIGGWISEPALRAVTATPCRLAGIGNRYGTIETLRSATLILTEGHPLEITSSVTHACIDGRAIDLDSHQSQMKAKYDEKIDRALEKK